MLRMLTGIRLPGKSFAAVVVVLLLPLVIPGSNSVFAQTTYKGKVLDASTGQALPAVSVYVPETTSGTTTDRNGEFVLRMIRRPTVISFSSLGYRTVTLTDEQILNSLLVELVPTSIDLSPVVVVASREMEPRTRIPSSISSISASQIDDSKPSMLYQALNQVSGVHVVDLGNEQYKMSVRQPFSNKAYFLYMEDGIPLRPAGIFNPNALIDINMAGIDRIEIVRGPVSAMYGSNAVAGALNFVTPTPATAPSASVSGRIDNRGYKRTDASTAMVSDNLSLYVGGYAARQRNGWFDHSDFDKLALTARADHAFSNRMRLSSAVTISRMDTDTNGALDSLNFYSRDISSLYTFTYREMNAVRARATLFRTWSEHQRSQITGYFRKSRIGQLPYYRIRTKRSDPTEATGEINEDAFWSLGWIGQHELFIPTLHSRIVAGASFDRSPASYSAEYIDVEKDALGRYASFSRPDSLLSDYDVLISNIASYVRLEVEPLDQVRLISSLRYDHLRFDYDNHLDPEAYSGAPDGVSTFNKLSPKIGITVDLQRGRGAYANYSLGFVPPEVIELYSGVKIPNLKSARFASYEIGGWATIYAGRLFLDASIYHMDGIDEIIPVILDDGSRENRNAGRTQHRGIELTLLYQPSSLFSLRFSGSRADHEFVKYNENGTDYSGNEMMNAPQWITNGEVAFSPPSVSNLRFAVEWQRVSSYQMDNGNTETYRGYDVFHARAAFTRGGWQLWLNVNNVFDAVYATTAAAYTFGDLYNAGQVRTLSLGLRYRR